MNIYDPLRMNNWPIKTFLIFVLSIQLALWGMVSLDSIGLDILIVRLIIGLTYLVAIPGTLILRLLKLHRLGTIETLLYTIGLSLTTLMFTGFFLNSISQFLGISTPISLFPLLISLTLIVFALSAACYFIDDSSSDFDFIDIREILSPQLLFLLLIPIMTSFGTYLVNYYNNNSLLIFVLVLISSIVVIVGSKGIIPTKLYPFTLWIVTVSLIWHFTLVSLYVNVGDVVGEYYFANLVIKNSFWDWTIQDNYNSVLSCVILAPIFNIITKLDLTWVFKLIYPLLYSFTPLAAYKIFLKETKDDKVSFLSSFLYISVLPFFSRIPLITKQSIAELFLLLLLINLIDENIGNVRKSLLSVIFSISLIVSHYGTSYLILGLFFFVFILYNFMEHIKYDGKRIRISIKKLNTEVDLHTKIIPLNLVLIFMVFTFAWYMYTSDSSSFNSLVELGNRVSNTIYTDFLNPDGSRGLYLLTRNESSLLRSINKFHYIIIQFFIMIGFVKKVSNYKNLQYDFLYMAISSFFICVLFSAIAVSGFAVMDPQRLFHLSLITLAPFSIVGWLYVSEYILCKFRVNIKNFRATSLKIFSLSLAVFLLFNVGLVYEFTHDHPISIPISQNSIRNYGDSLDKAIFYGGYIVTQNVFSGKWLGTNMNSSLYVYRGDFVQEFPSLTIYGGVNESMIKQFSNNTKEMPEGYIQLTYENIIYKIGSTRDNVLQKRSVYSFSDLYLRFEKTNKIYNNGGSQILISYNNIPL